MYATKPQFLLARRCSSVRGHIILMEAMGPKRPNSRARIFFGGGGIVSGRGGGWKERFVRAEG